jgi:hypothetical protein
MLGKDRSFGVVEVTRSGYEGDGPASVELNHFGDGRAGLVASELRQVPPRELRETFRSMTVELAELGTRRKILAPLIEVGSFFAQPAGPQSINEDPDAIAARWLLVRTLDRDRVDAWGGGHRSCPFSGTGRVQPAGTVTIGRTA